MWRCTVFGAARTLACQYRSEFKVVGIMVRDVDPDELDMMPVMRGIEMDDSAYVELLALYIPKRISALAEHVRIET